LETAGSEMRSTLAAPPFCEMNLLHELILSMSSGELGVTRTN
jgi:hypothetical protein